MIDKKTLKLYEEFLQGMVNDFDYSYIDGFVEQHELSEEQIDELLHLNISVSIENK